MQPDIKDRKAFQIGAKIAVMHSDADISKWLCTNPDLTCWEKMHQFHLPRNVFAKSTSNSKDHPLLYLNRRSTMCKTRKLFCDESATMSVEAEMLQSEIDGDVCLSGCFSPRAPAQRPVAEGRMHRSGIVSSPNSNDPVVETFSVESESEGELCVSGGSSTSPCSSHQMTPTQHPVDEGRKPRSGTVSLPNANCRL